MAQVRATGAGLLCACALAAADLGVFEASRDVGTVLHAGSVAYDAANGAYTVKGSGENMWFGADDFHFVWKQVSGDAAISADIRFPAAGGNAHRKAVLMFRQSLDPDSAYADAALHGDGLTSLQFRDAKGSATHEVQAAVSAPPRVRLEKRGDHFYLWTGSGDRGVFTAGSPAVALKPPFYMGIGVCAHDKDAVETAVFSNVDIGKPLESAAPLYSTLETVAIASTDRRALYAIAGRIESAAWTRDGNSIVFKSTGSTEQVPASGGPPQRVEAGAAAAAGAPQQSEYFASDRSGSMQVWRTPREGGAPEQITRDAFTNCFPHLSPDGKQLAVLSYDTPVKGCPQDQPATLRILGPEGQQVKAVARLTAGPGTLDAPPWSPDGRKLVFVAYHHLR